MKAIERLKTFLKQQTQLMRKIYPHPDWKYGGFEELILDCGREMKYAPLPKNIERGLPKSCYYNCLELIREHPDLAYCEGYALTDDLPFPLAHAWLVKKDEEVIDPTWEVGEAYLGVPFDTLWLVSFLESRNRDDYLAVFESNYMEDFSLLKEGLPDRAIAKF